IDSSIDWDILIVDNASTDQTAIILDIEAQRNPRLKILHVEKIGLGAGRDAAWRKANGEVISFTDDDCLPEPSYVDQIWAAFRRYPRAGCIGGRIELFNPHDAELTVDRSLTPRVYDPCSFLRTAQVHGANISFRKEALKSSGVFDSQFGAGTPFPAEDVDAAAAVLWAGWEVRYDPGPVVLHNHGRNNSQARELLKRYDFGRGAYFAKYLLRSDSRHAYIRGICGELGRFSYIAQIGRVLREVHGAFSYLWANRRYGLFFTLAFPATIALFITAIVITARRGLRIARQKGTAPARDRVR
ncbi:glycosyltransferase, partial [Nostoc sp. NIES-2111]